MKRKRRRIIVLIVICIVVLISLLLLGLFAFNTKVTKCTLVDDQKQNNYKVETNYNIYYKNGIVTKVEENEVLTSKNTTIVKYFEKLRRDAYDKKYKGYTFTINNERTKLISNKVIDYNILDVKNYINDNSTLSSYINKNNKLTIEKAKEMYESLGASCK